MKTVQSSDKTESPKANGGALGRRLVQSRLPFQVISKTSDADPSPKVIKPPNNASDSRKRKLSTSPESDERITKVGRITKDNDTNDTNVPTEVKEECTTPPRVINLDTDSEPSIEENPTFKIKLPLRSKRKALKQKNVEDCESKESQLDKKHENSKVVENEIILLSDPEDVDMDEPISSESNDSSTTKDTNTESIITPLTESNSNEPRSDTVKDLPSEEDESSSHSKVSSSTSTNDISMNGTKDEIINLSDEEQILDTTVEQKNSVKSPKVDDETKKEKRKLAAARRRERIRQKEEQAKALIEAKKNNPDVDPDILVKTIVEEMKKKEREEKEELKIAKLKLKEAQKEIESQLKNEEKQQREQEKKAKLDEKQKKIEERQREQQRREDEKREKKLKKEEERLRREEDRVRKEEEKRLKEEERKQKETERENKLKRTSQAFLNFFKPISNVPKTGNQQPETRAVHAFKPFPLKEGMKLAPTVRRNLTVDNIELLDNVINGNQNVSKNSLYLAELRKGSINPVKFQGRDPKIDDSDDVVFVPDDDIGDVIPPDSAAHLGLTRKTYRAKYFQFHENQRPPYYGTWRKRSSTIGPRTPFNTDKVHFDYEVDSDDEWEEEEPGESLHGSEDEEKESDDDYEVDNEFFVPHGFLSDEELANAGDDMDDNSPETQKIKLKLMQQEFANERKEKTTQLKTRIVGPIWVTEDGEKPDSCRDNVWNYLMKRAIIVVGPLILTAEKEAMELESKKNECPTIEKIIRNNFSKDTIKQLIRLVHGNINRKDFMAQEFLQYLKSSIEADEDESIKYISKAGIKVKIQELAEWKQCTDEGPMFKKYCWYVPPDKLADYELSNLDVLNSWSYTLTPKRKVQDPETALHQESIEKKVTPKENAKTPSSTLTIKKLFGNKTSKTPKQLNFSVIPK